MIIAAHNSERTLAHTLSSAIASIYDNIEIIVVDDSSTDGTAAIVERFIAQDRRVRLHRRKRGGVAAALNSALALARGDYVAPLDSDDLWHPTKIAKQVELARRDPQAAFIYTFLRMIDDGASVLEDVPQQMFPRRALVRGLYESLAGTGSSALIRRSALEEIGGYDESLMSRQDLLVQLRISARHPIAVVPEYLVGYRVTPGSLSSNPQAMLDSWKIVRRRIDQFFAEVPLRVRRWGCAAQFVELAEGFAWQRRYFAAARLLIQALALDPARTALYLGHRTARRLKRRAMDAEAGAPTPLFKDCDPSMPLPRAIVREEAAGKTATAFEQRRIRRLTQLDEQIAAAAPMSRFRPVALSSSAGDET